MEHYINCFQHELTGKLKLYVRIYAEMEEKTSMDLFRLITLGIIIPVSNQTMKDFITTNHLK